jgi:GT2 family glycosyltransferase
VVITRDRVASLLRTLGELERLPERPPVIVVDHGAGAGAGDGAARRVAAAHPGVGLMTPGVDRGGAGRTAGVLAARTPYVAFSDDDSWWAPGALARAAALLAASPSIGLLAARVLLPDGRLDPVCEAMARSPLGHAPGLPGPHVLGFVACGAVVRRSAYLGVGGFDARYGVGGEETPLAAALVDAGWAVAYAPELVAHHHPSTRRDPGARRVTETRNRLWFAWQRRSARAALAVTVETAGEARRDPAARAALLGAARGAPRLLRARRPVSPRTERGLALLEGR